MPDCYMLSLLLTRSSFVLWQFKTTSSKEQTKSPHLSEHTFPFVSTADGPDKTRCSAWNNELKFHIASLPTKSKSDYTLQGIYILFKTSDWRREKWKPEMYCLGVVQLLKMFFNFYFLNNSREKCFSLPGCWLFALHIKFFSFENFVGVANSK